MRIRRLPSDGWGSNYQDALKARWETHLRGACARPTSFGDKNALKSEMALHQRNIQFYISEEWRDLSNNQRFD